MPKLEELSFDSTEICPNCGQHTGGESICPNCGAVLYDEEGLNAYDEDEDIDGK